MTRLSRSKAIFAVLLIISVIFTVACQQKNSNQSNTQTSSVQTPQISDISNSLNGASTVDSDLNVEDNSSETDSGLDDAQTI